ncbi:MAG TPA: thioesterase family protein [Burkholderiales bacterium]|nr:thioesterase family protein [Burkholderiales bacterium]
MPSPTIPAVASSAYVARGERAYDATELTRGPWDPGHQHAGPAVALVAREIARPAAALGMSHIARLTANLIRPVPIGPIEVEVATDYAGRNVAHFSARLLAGGREIARFTAVAQRDAKVDLPAQIAGHPLPQAAKAPQASEPAAFPARSEGIGYHDLVELRIAEGTPLRGPCAVWIRMRHPLVLHETPSGIERVAVAADSANGISAVLEFRRYTFVNSDLTINLLRRAQGEWICVEARTLLGPGGGGIAEARLFDSRGLIGRSTQSLQVRAR